MMDEFFVGWRDVGPRLRGFLRLAALGTLLAAPLLALVLGATARDPEGASWALVPGSAALTPLPMGEAVLTGVLTLRPSPVLHLPAGPEAPRGRPVLLAEDGKRGAVLPAEMDGRAVTATGFILSRGSLDMLVLGAMPVAAPRPVDGPAVEPLGRWRISGEICDGKCATGGMRPGSGVGHRACAVLCLEGELPAVFVANAPVAGSAFLLLGGSDGGLLPAALHARVGQPVTLVGRVERRGGLLVLLVESHP
jgi:hypothetical protein